MMQHSSFFLKNKLSAPQCNRMKHLTRFEATQQLQKLIGQDLRKLADKHGVTVFKNGKLNKGWAGLTLEKALGIGNNTIQASNGDFWELKLIPLRKRKDGLWRVKAG